MLRSRTILIFCSPLQEIYKIVSTKGLDEMPASTRPDTITIAPSNQSHKQEPKGCC